MLKQRLMNLYTRMFVSRRFAALNRKLFFMSLRGLGLFNYENFRLSGERFLVSRVVPLSLGGPAPVLVDVGANVGDYSAMLRECFPDAAIHAFEPHPRNFQRLTGRGIPGLQAHNLALGHEEATMTLYDRDDDDGSMHASLYREVITEIQGRGFVERSIRVRSLDAVAQELGLPRVDYLKVDTEGHELAVLRGAQRLLEQQAIGCIHFEFNEMNVVSRCFLRDFRQALPSYDFFRLLPDGLLHLPADVPVLSELFGFQNVVALPRQLARSREVARLQ